MELNAQEMMEKLKNDRGALEQLMHSADGMRLMQLLTQGDGGAALRNAAGSAAKGDTTQMAQMVQKLMQSQEGAARQNASAAAWGCKKQGGDGVSDFDEKLNSILNNPDSMAQIMQLAQSLSGGSQSASGGSASSFTPPTAPPPPHPNNTGTGDGFDPQMLHRFLPLIKEMQSQESSNASQLLLALRPYLKAEKQEKVGRAIQIAKLIRMGKHFFSGLEG